MIWRSKYHRRPRGFTLVEILVTMTLMALLTIGLLRFLLQALNIYYYDGGRLMVNKDVRTFTADLAKDAVASNYFRIYPDFQTRTAAVTDGNSGEFLVLVFTDPPDSTSTTGAYIITKLVGYYRDPVDPTDPTSLGPVRRFELPVADADKSKDLGTLLTTAGYAPTTSAHSYPVVIQLAQGLADGNLFYDYYDRSVMIRGQIVEYGSQGGKAAVNTYNFTVSPRG